MKKCSKIILCAGLALILIVCLGVGPNLYKHWKYTQDALVEPSHYLKIENTLYHKERDKIVLTIRNSSSENTTVGRTKEAENVPLHVLKAFGISSNLGMARLEQKYSLVELGPRESKKVSFSQVTPMKQNKENEETIIQEAKWSFSFIKDSHGSHYGFYELNFSNE